ncbi:MAG: ATP-binding protein [Anaerolineaceae bacterium]
MELNSSEFYLGQAYDLAAKAVIPDKLIFYDPSDLTTHAVITGMTGSGKTGMGIILLEEAALQGIPAILIDPKGDLTNHLLHFPNLLPSDFAPWVDEDIARREGKTPEQTAAEAADSWQKGLERSGIDQARMQKLATNVDYAIYTPGSDSGFSVSILSSLKAPSIPWAENKETLRENISSTATALLELVGYKNIDPVRSREHILLSNIFENAWSQGHDLDLESLIMQVQTPPFEKLGVFPLSKFYPEKDRFELAMALNNFIAAPSFEDWLQGQPLDIGAFLYSPDGKPRHSVFYLAHLADQERMFFITLLYSAVETWMRTQSGTSSLRALVYFDEIVGYLPPVANPPSKPIILRLLKQARAFGVGLVLATQNPIDLDYKALSNAGTWIIGKLQTDQDKQRLLDGLATATGTFDRGYFDTTISALGKRVFLLHNVHAKTPEIFTTRWAMNYLPGPIMRTKISELNRLVGADVLQISSAAAGRAPISVEEVRGGTSQNLPGSPNEPFLSSNVSVVYLPVTVSLSEALKLAAKRGIPSSAEPRYHYEPVLVGQAKVYFANRTYGVDLEKKVSINLPGIEGRGLVRWIDYQHDPIDMLATESRPLPNATFGDLRYPFDDEKNIASLSKDFQEWIYRDNSLTLYTNDKLKLTSKPGESREEFEARCTQASQGGQSDAVKKIEEKYEKLRKSIEAKKMKEEIELEKDKKILNQRRMEEAGTGLSTVISLFSGRKKSVNSSLTKRRLTSTAKSDLEESELMIEEYNKQLAELDAKMKEELDAYQESAQETVGTIREVTINPLKKDIVEEFFGVGWLPYYAFKDGDRWVLIPGYR